jgi:hypothetical protein
MALLTAQLDICASTPLVKNKISLLAETSRLQNPAEDAATRQRAWIQAMIVQDFGLVHNLGLQPLYGALARPDEVLLGLHALSGRGHLAGRPIDEAPHVIIVSCVPALQLLQLVR